MLMAYFSNNVISGTKKKDMDMLKRTKVSFSRVFSKHQDRKEKDCPRVEEVTCVRLLG